LTVQTEGKRKVKRKIEYYNLDVIISVGYRVKSLRGIQFRQWATQRLKDYLVQGYAINEKRLAEKQMQLEMLQSGIRILHRALEENKNQDSLAFFTAGLELLDQYDHQSIRAEGAVTKQAVYPTLEDYLHIINSLKPEFGSAVFAVPKDQSFESAISQIAQTFDGKELYPTIEEKEAVLLYLIVKNHAFADGNKRIGAACFLHFLHVNGLLFDTEGTPIISNETLAALTLFVAVSKPEEKDLVVKLTVNILNKGQSHDRTRNI
jgi:prophage maintenance system killer protein